MELKSTDQLIAEALQKRQIRQSQELLWTEKQRLKAMKEARRLAKATMTKLPRFWWLGAFAPKVRMAQKIAELESILEQYKNHATYQSDALSRIFVSMENKQLLGELPEDLVAQYQKQKRSV